MNDPVFSLELRRMVGDAIDANLNPRPQFPNFDWSVLLAARESECTTYISNVQAPRVIEMLNRYLHDNARHQLPSRYDHAMVTRLDRAGNQIRRLMQTRAGVRGGYMLTVLPLDAKYNGAICMVTNVKPEAVSMVVAKQLEHFATSFDDVAGHA